MKKFIKTFLVALLLIPCMFGLAACGDDNDNNSGGSSGGNAGGNNAGGNGGNTNTSSSWYTAVSQQLNNKSFSLYKQDEADGDSWEYEKVEICGDDILVKLRLAEDSDWSITYYHYNGTKWVYNSYDADDGWRGEMDTTYWESDTLRSDAFISAIMITYDASYSEAKTKNSSGTVDINGKTCTKHDSTVMYQGELYGSIYYMWNDLVVAQDYYLDGCRRLNEIRNITPITNLSMMPAQQ